LITKEAIITADVVDPTAVVTNVFTGAGAALSADGSLRSGVLLGVIGSSPLACTKETLQKGRAVAVSPTAFLALADSAETMQLGRAVAVSPTAFLALAGSAETMLMVSVGCTRTGWPLRRRRQTTAVGLQKPAHVRATENPSNENDEPYDYPEYSRGPLESGREWCIWESHDIQEIAHSFTITAEVQPKEYALESPLTPSEIVNDAARALYCAFSEGEDPIEKEAVRDLCFHVAELEMSSAMRKKVFVKVITRATELGTDDASNKLAMKAMINLFKEIVSLPPIEHFNF
jgi:hypothetical protein